ncbi:MAG: hypothetical protein AAGJ81_09435 [Verrucomicrobiota bacterium]
MPSFRRKQLQHDIPNWVHDGEIFFITINCLPRGANQLANAAIAEAIFQSVSFYEEAHKWKVRLLLLMPDHLHALVSFNTRLFPLRKTVQDFKRFIARNHSVCWQRYFFDHRIRNASELDEKTSYVLSNPVRAGLVEKADDWPYVRG